MSVAVRTAFGLLIGLGIALLLELHDQTVRSEDDIIAIGAGPVLGRIPFDRGISTEPLMGAVNRQSVLAEAFRQMRTSLQFVDVERPVQVLVVTSAGPGEGKSITSSNLALSLMETGRTVLLIEADLRMPQVSNYFKLDRSAGLTDVLIDRATLDGVLRPIEKGLTVLPSGHHPPNPSELLGSETMRTLLTELRSRFEIIVVDTPPLLPVADGAVAASWADGVLLLARSGKTTRHQVVLSLRSLESVGARLVGSVLTMMPATRGSRYLTYEYGSEAASSRSGSVQPTPVVRPSSPDPGRSGAVGSDRSTRSAAAAPTGAGAEAPPTEGGRPRVGPSRAESGLAPVAPEGSHPEPGAEMGEVGSGPSQRPGSATRARVAPARAKRTVVKPPNGSNPGGGAPKQDSGAIPPPPGAPPPGQRTRAAGGSDASDRKPQ